jgi:hypothetical protein
VESDEDKPVLVIKSAKKKAPKIEKVKEPETTSLNKEHIQQLVEQQIKKIIALELTQKLAPTEKPKKDTVDQKEITKKEYSTSKDKRDQE